MAESPNDGKTERNSDDWKAKGDDFYRKKEYVSAVDAYSKAIDLNKDAASLYSNRAAANLMNLKYREAVTDCDASLALEGGNAKVHFRKAAALKGLGNIDAAIDALSAGLAIDPSSNVAESDRKMLVGAKERLREVKNKLERKEFRSAMTAIDGLVKDLGPTFRELNLLKAECFLGLKRVEEAYNMTNALMRSSTVGDLNLLLLRAKCFYAMGDLENALKHMQSALRTDPDNSTARSYYRHLKEFSDKKEAGNAAFKAGNYQEAVDLWTEVINQDPTNQVLASKLYCNRANAKSKLKQHEAAVADCDKAIRLDPEFVKAYLRRADSNFAIGEPENLQQTIRDYEKAMELQPEESNGLKDKLRQAKVALKRSKEVDLYKVLGVPPNADDNEIKKAYRKAALVHHPDRLTGKSEEEKAKSEAAFKEINLAYEMLSNPETRAKYDQGVEVNDLDNPHAHPGGGHCGFGGGGHGGIDPNIIFQMFAQQQRQGRG